MPAEKDRTSESAAHLADSDATIASAIRALCKARGPAKTICPSEVARRIAEEGTRSETYWRELMPAVRRVAGELVRAGEISATQKGAPVDPVTARGPIRLGLRSH